MKSSQANAYVLRTKLGPMAVLCQETKILKSILPCDSLVQLERLVKESWRSNLIEESSDFLDELTKRIDQLWSGHAEDFCDYLLDLSLCTPFQQEVYAELRKVSRAEVVSYSELAARLGKPNAARAIGGALRANPLPLFIPCHRVLAKAGMGGFTAPGGLQQKYVLLRAEGWQVPLQDRGTH